MVRKESDRSGGRNLFLNPHLVQQVRHELIHSEIREVMVVGVKRFSIFHHRTFFCVTEPIRRIEDEEPWNLRFKFRGGFPKPIDSLLMDGTRN